MQEEIFETLKSSRTPDNRLIPLNSFEIWQAVGGQRRSVFKALDKLLQWGRISCVSIKPKIGRRIRYFYIW